MTKETLIGPEIEYLSDARGNGGCYIQSLGFINRYSGKNMLEGVAKCGLGQKMGRTALAPQALILAFW
jgi:hypothetical protein